MQKPILKVVGESLVDIIARDKTSLDISWLKDKSLADLVLANDIIENMEAGLEGFRAIMAALSKNT